MRFIRIGEDTIAVDCIKCVFREEVMDSVQPPYRSWRIVVKLKDGAMYFPMYGERDAVIAEYEKASAELTGASKEGEENE